MDVLTGAAHQGARDLVGDAASVTALSNKSGLANRDSTRVPVPSLDSHRQPAKHHPNLQLRLNFREIGLVPRFLRARRNRSVGSRPLNVPGVQLSLFHEFPALHWGRVPSPHPRRLNHSWLGAPCLVGASTENEGLAGLRKYTNVYIALTMPGNFRIGLYFAKKAL